jgi:hypothetical protein
MSNSPSPVVFVAGSGHTGSTLLALVLDSHPEIACVGEVAIKPKILRHGPGAAQACSCGATVGQCPFWTSVFGMVRATGLDFGAENWTNDYRFHNVLAQKALKRLCTTPGGRNVVRWAADHLPVYSGMMQGKDRVNLAFIKAVLEQSDARVFADTSKSMPRLLHLSRLSPLDIKVIQLSRDVRGYAASAKRRRAIRVADSARTWLRDQTAIREVAATLPAGRVFHLRYEDLCGRVGETQEKLWPFIGVRRVPMYDSVLATDHHVLGNNMRLGGAIRLRLDESWRERLTAAEQDEVLTIAGDMNRALGHDT